MRAPRVFTPFETKVHEFVRRIPKGRVATYGGVAAGVGRPGSSRAVGNVMRRNPDTAATPCHRVVRSDGDVGGYSGNGLGSARKAALLAREGVPVDRQGRIQDFPRFVWP